jgi:hypothetical protein
VPIYNVTSRKSKADIPPQECQLLYALEVPRRLRPKAALDAPISPRENEFPVTQI